MRFFPIEKPLWAVVTFMVAAIVVLITSGNIRADAVGDSETVVAKPLSVAVLPFASSTKHLKDISEEMSTLLTAYLSAEPSVILVERAEVDKVLSEMELGQSGTVDPATAARIGHLTGAQVLISGRVFPVQREIVIVAKVIGVETGRVYGETISFPPRGSVVQAGQELATKIGILIGAKGETLIAKAEDKEDVIARLRRQVEGKTLPSVSVSIPEVSLNRLSIDPAAETEIAFILQSLGFEIVDPRASNKMADVEITGEAFSEFGLRKGNLVSSRGRVEVKAIHRGPGKVLLVAREVSVAVDIAPEIAGKAAIAKSAAKLAERLVTALLRVEPE